MNKKKTLIPIVAIGALILSLLVVLPAFGAGTASFIQPDDVGKDEPKEQTYGMQGGPIGLRLDDSSLDVPVRRVLIPDLDTSLDGYGHIEAHSDEILASSESVAKDDYIAVGSNSVRKVTKVEDADVPANATPVAAATGDSPSEGNLPTHTWTLEMPVEKVGANVSGGNYLPGAVGPITVGGFSSTSNGAITVSALATPTGFPEDIDINNNLGGTLGSGGVITITNAEGSTRLLLLDQDDDNSPDAESVTEDEVTQDASYTLKFNVTQAEDSQATPTIPATTKTVAVVLKFYYGRKITVDSPFASSNDRSMTPLAIHEVNEELTGTGANAISSWSDNYAQHAMAITLDDTHDGTALTSDANVKAGGGASLVRHDVENGLIVGSNIGASDKGRHKGTSASRLRGNDDAMVIRVPDQTGATPTPVAMDTIDEDRVIFAGTNNTQDLLGNNPGGNFEGDAFYLVAWFDEINDTGNTVSVHSRQHTARSVVVLQETDFDSGMFDLRIGTVNSDVQDEADFDGNRVLQLPVGPDDVVTLTSADSSAILDIETTKPSFSDFSPEHNAASRNDPDFTAQVTDSASEVDKASIRILFKIEETRADGTVTGTFYESFKPASRDFDEISGGYEVTGQIVRNVSDATVSWWVMAKDNAGNVGFSDRSPTDEDGQPDTCDANEVTTSTSAQIAELEKDTSKCQAHKVFVDGTTPALRGAVTGRNWNVSQDGISKDDDKTDYRANKAKKNIVLAIFSEPLDASTVTASDFRVASRNPVDADVRNVTVREGADVGNRRGYVFLTLSSDLDPSATPKVEVIDDVLDLAGNELDDAEIASAEDGIAPTLTVTIDEGVRPVTNDSINLTITADEDTKKPTITYVPVVSSGKKAEGKAKVGSGFFSVDPKFVSNSERTAVIKHSGDAGLYSIHVSAIDSAGGNTGEYGDKEGEIDISSDTKALLFEYDNVDPILDVDPGMDGNQTTFELDDQNGYIRFSFTSEKHEYDTEGDDLDNYNGVSIVSATLNGNDIKDDLKGDAAGTTFLYKSAEPLEYGVHDLEVLAKDMAGNSPSAPEEATITVKERDPFSLDLNPGWNLVSLPGDPMDADINTVIPTDRTDISMVMAYEPSVPGKWLTAARGADGMFAGTLKNITSSRGYWVQTDSFTALKVNIPKQPVGRPATLQEIRLTAGWNLVPVIDIDGDFEMTNDQKTKYLAALGEDARVYTFNTIANRWEQVTKVELGKAYWVYVAKVTVIIP